MPLASARRSLAVATASLLHRSTTVRAGFALLLAVVLAGGAVGGSGPVLTTATPPSPNVPLTQAAFRTTVATDHGLTAPVAITFTTPMNEASVAAALRVEPPTAVELRWDLTGEVLTIAPATTWQAGTFHTISVQPGARAKTGQSLSKAARAVFMTRLATTSEVSPTKRMGDRVSTETGFQITFTGPVNAATIPAAIRLDPAVPGSVHVVSTGEGSSRYTFVPATPLRPDARYDFTVSGVRDADGLILEPMSLAVRTVSAPAVKEFRPATDAADVARDAPISVRFSEPMDTRATAQALRVTIDGKQVPGAIAWADENTVLGFTPDTALPFETRVAIEIAATAESARHVPLEAPAQATFRTVAAPAPPAPPSPRLNANTTNPTPTKTAAKAPTTTRPTKRTTGGSAVGGGRWAAVETYYLGLMNCTRTGGWVTASGSCSSPGGRDVAPLKLDAGISSKVSRPYARMVATENLCSHFIGGSPANRLKAAGYTSYRWAENLGCRSGDPRAAVLATHLFFQSERPYNGGHYVNLMNAKYDRVGIGVWSSGGRVRLVIDFYHS
jgi:uncharacterized protein YkwD